MNRLVPHMLEAGGARPGTYNPNPVYAEPRLIVHIKSGRPGLPQPGLTRPMSTQVLFFVVVFNT